MANQKIVGGRKLYPGMMVEVPEVGTFFMVKKGNDDNEAE